mgnify:CR=1 FL=1
MQFIVTTHAPAVINSVKSSNLIILKGSQILQLDNQVYGKDVNSVLNEIMGVDERPPEAAKLFNEFYDLVAAKEFDMVDQTDRRDTGQGLDYNNFVAVCHGNKGPHGTRTIADLTCDAHKGNMEFRKINPERFS